MSKKSLIGIFLIFTLLFISITLMSLLSVGIVNFLIDTELQIGEFFIMENMSNKFVFISLIIGQGMGMILTYIIFIKFIHPINENLKISKQAFKNSITGTFVLLIVYLLSISLLFLSSSEGSVSETSHLIVDLIDKNDNIYFLLMIFISVGIIAPITEELLFRSLIQEYLLENFEVFSAIIITSIIFGLMHFGSASGNSLEIGLFYVTMTFFLSLVLGYYKEKTRNILVPIIMHSAYNIIIFTFIILP